MNRITFRISEAQDQELDRLVEEGEFPNKSEALRAATRRFLRNQRKDEILSP